MKLATLGSGGQGSSVKDESLVQFEGNATAFFAQISGVAEDKHGYPVRELVSNAWDASPEAVFVTLPTKEKPSFSVRDHGAGISHERMMGPFCRMYASDKRDDPTKIGGWGIGRFSAFSYLLSSGAGTFYRISSWQEGVRRDYIMDLSADGQPQLKHLFDTPSDEPSGLEVTFPVLAKDIPVFAAKVRQILWSFRPLPTVTPEIEWPQFEVAARSDNWTRYLNWPQGMPVGPHLRMGPVAYRINMDHPEIKEARGTFVHSYLPILFEAPIGSVQPTLSREDLAYDSRTISTIRDLFSTYAQELRDSAREAVAGAGSYFEACFLFEEIMRGLSYTVRDEVRQTVEWRGRRIVEQIQNNETMRLTRLPREWKRSPTMTFSATGIIPSHCVGHQLIIEHDPQYSVDKLVAGGLVGQPLVWARCSRQNLPEVLDQLGGIEDYRLLDEIKVERQKSDRPKYMRKRNLLLVNTVGYGFSRETREINLEEPQIYVRIKGSVRSSYYSQWEGCDGKYVYATQFSQTASMLRRMGLTQELNIACVTILDEETKVPDNWVRLCDHMVALARPRLGDASISALAKIPTDKIPAEIRGLALLDRPLFNNGGPDQIQSLCQRIWEFGQEAEIKGRQHTNGVYHPAHGPSLRIGVDDRDVMLRLLASIGYSNKESEESAQQIVGEMQNRFSAIAMRHPLLRLLSTLNANEHYYGREVLRPSDALFEYERLVQQNHRNTEES